MNTYIGTITLKMLVRVRSESIEPATELVKRIACERQGIRPDHLEGVSVAPVVGDAALSADNLRHWQESEAIQRGTTSQQERWLRGVLPESELLEVARGELFRQFGLFAKRTPMGFADIDHPRKAGIWTCLTVPRASGPVTDASKLVTWATVHAPDLREREATTLRALNEAARAAADHPWLQQGPQTAVLRPEVVGVSPREHRGVCQVCEHSVYERSALVSIYWAGRILSREYVL
jgi:hypothetical protein